MDLPVIGSHCSLATCRDLDLLPIKCRCDKVFCRYHISPESHECPVDPAEHRESVGASFEKLERCAAENCNKPSLDAFVGGASNESKSSAGCPHCQKAFCASHRHTDSHTCSKPQLSTQNSNKNPAGQALLAKHFPSTSGAVLSATNSQRVPAKTSSDPKKLAQLHQVELMKMRHRAIPGDPKDKPSSTLVDQRLHVKVKLEDPKYASKEGVFWFRKTMGTGRALDLLAIHLGVPPSDSSPRQLLKVSADPSQFSTLRNDQPLISQLEEGSSIIIACL